MKERPARGPVCLVCRVPRKGVLRHVPTHANTSTLLRAALAWAVGLGGFPSSRLFAFLTVSMDSLSKMFGKTNKSNMQGSGVVPGRQQVL